MSGRMEVSMGWVQATPTGRTLRQRFSSSSLRMGEVNNMTIRVLVLATWLVLVAASAYIDELATPSADVWGFYPCDNCERQEHDYFTQGN
jgi:hypothetical protein